MHVPWCQAFRIMNIREKELQKNNHRIAILKSANQNKIILGPNESKDIYCFSDRELDMQPTPAVTTESSLTGLPKFVDITPALVNYSFSKGQLIVVNISDLTTNSVVISPKTVICELQPATIEQNMYRVNM